VNRILLVDDHPPQESHFRRLFDDVFEVDVCRNYDDVARVVSKGTSWSAAFVDFDLSGTVEEPQRTGLSVLRLLLRDRPQTQRIAYTTLGDNGRDLYAVAARHWLDTKIILHKASDERALRDAACLGAPNANPTPPAWEEKLKSAYLIDDLFAQYNWLSLWRIWRFYNGSTKAVRDHLPPGSSYTSVLEFSKKATLAVDNFRYAFEGPKSTTYERKKAAQATPLVAFADANSKFFHSPDLGEIIDFAKPWDRVRARLQR
jgi:hypothetical protein